MSETGHNAAYRCAAHASNCPTCPVSLIASLLSPLPRRRPLRPRPAARRALSVSLPVPSPLRSLPGLLRDSELPYGLTVLTA